MSAVIENESTELVELPAQESALAVYSTIGGLNPLIEQIRAKIAGTVYDMKTAKGRAECASDAFKVAKSKAAIEKLGKALSAEYKEIPKKIDAERRRAFEELEALQHEVRRPLTEWEEVEEARVAAHKLRISQMSIADTEGRTTEEIASAISLIEEYVIDAAWEEFEAEAARAKDTALSKLRAALTSRQKYEAEQAELAKLRIEAEERRKQDERERIAKEAADRATKAAEAKAQAEREKAAKEVADAKASAERRELELKLQAEKAERGRLEAIQKAEQAERDAKARVEAARLDEIKRQADETARIEAETKKREADRAHKAKINNAAVAALVAGGMDPEAAKLAVTLICKGKVPAIKINY